MNRIETVRENYNGNPELEWERLSRHPFEWAVTLRFLDRYVCPGERVLDIGGGPGRYSLYLAKKGCKVTLLDLAEENVRLAEEKAAEAGISFKALSGDAREADRHPGLAGNSFDHVLLMGPLYHLLEEEDRIRAVEAALALLKPGGLLYASFISLYAQMIDMMARYPEDILSKTPGGLRYAEALLSDKSFAGRQFTEVYYARSGEVLPFFERFPLKKRHLFGQEGVAAPCEPVLQAASSEAVKAWTDLSEALCEREELFCFSEHLMYIGQKEDRT